MTTLQNIAEAFQGDLPEIVPPAQQAMDLSSARMVIYSTYGYNEEEDEEPDEDGCVPIKGLIRNDDGTLALECQMDNGEEVETVYVPQHLVGLAEYMFEVDQMQGHAMAIDGRLTLITVSAHGTLQDGYGNYYEHGTYKPVDKHGKELAA